MVSGVGVLCQDIADIRAGKGGRLAIEVVEDTSKKLLNLLGHGKFRYQPLRDEPVSVVVGHSHPPFIQKRLRLELQSKQQAFGIVTRTGGVLSPAAEQFIQLLRDRNMVH